MGWFCTKAPGSSTQFPTLTLFRFLSQVCFPLQEASLVWGLVSLAWLIINCASTWSFLFLGKGTFNQLAVSLGREDRNLLHIRIPAGGYHAGASCKAAPATPHDNDTPASSSQKEVWDSGLSVATGWLYHILEPLLEMMQVISKYFSQKISLLYSGAY